MGIGTIIILGLLAVYFFYLMRNQQKSELRSLVNKLLLKKGEELIGFRELSSPTASFDDLSERDKIGINVANQLTNNNLFSTRLFEVMILKDQQKEICYHLTVLYEGHEIIRHKWELQNPQ